MDFPFKRFFSRTRRPSEKEEPSAAPAAAPPFGGEANQRAFSRFPVALEVRIIVPDKDASSSFEQSKLQDVSGGGALFVSHSPEKYFKGQHLKLEIFLAGTRDVRACVKVGATVVRILEVKRAPSNEPSNEIDLTGGNIPDPPGKTTKTGIAVKFDEPFEFERLDRSFFSGSPL